MKNFQINSPDINVSMTKDEIFILVMLLNRMQIEGLRNTFLNTAKLSMSREAYLQWMKESVEEHDFVMTLKMKLQRDL